MKRNFTTLTVIIFVISLMHSCKKGNEYKINHGAAELKGCPITQVVRDRFGTLDTLIFAYNNWGDPTMITKLPYPTTGSPNYIFKYDKKKRLTDIIGMYRGTAGAEVWHKYYYDNPGNDNISRDSTYTFVQISNGMIVNYLFSALTFYTYDKYDRIIKDSTPIPGYLYGVHNYSYDVNGNRVGRTYDNKINMLRINKIWMFYSRDYSVNNPFAADAYNANGLPTQLDLFSKGTFLKFMGEDYYNAQITYPCN